MDFSTRRDRNSDRPLDSLISRFPLGQSGCLCNKSTDQRYHVAQSALYNARRLARGKLFSRSDSTPRPGTSVRSDVPGAKLPHVRLIVIALEQFRTGPSFLLLIPRRANACG